MTTRETSHHMCVLLIVPKKWVMNDCKHTVFGHNWSPLLCSEVQNSEHIEAHTVVQTQQSLQMLLSVETT